MDSEQRIQALEQEVQILKNQIQSILLDVQSYLLTNAYPALRDHHTAGSSAEDDEDDDEYDRAASAPKVRKVTSNGAAHKKEKTKPPITPAEPVLASLDEQQDWVLKNIQSVGVDGTRELIEENTRKRRFTPEVSDTLTRFTDIYAAAADEPTLPSRPEGMPSSVTVKAVTAPPTKAPRSTQKPVVSMPAPEPVKPAPKPAVVKPKAAAPIVPDPLEEQFEGDVADENIEADASSLVLRLIAGVQNAGAGVRWGKTKN